MNLQPFAGCPYVTEIAEILKDAAAPEAARHEILHRVSRLGQRLNGKHRVALIDAAYKALEAR